MADSTPESTLEISSDTGGTAERLRFSWTAVWKFISRPFRRFTLLWCFLLLITANVTLLRIALVIVLLHIVLDLIAILHITLFSASVVARLETSIRKSTEGLISKIASVTAETEPTPDLKTIWSQLSGMQAGLRLLRNQQLVSRWAMFLGAVYLGCIYIYIAVLFSFAYYGLARVQSITLSWPNALVTSLFIPVAFTDLPRNFWIKLGGGIHWLVIISITASTVLGYITSKVKQIQKVATVLSERLSDEDVQTRLVILEQKFKATDGGKGPPAGSAT